MKLWKLTVLFAGKTTARYSQVNYLEFPDTCISNSNYIIFSKICFIIFRFNIASLKSPCHLKLFLLSIRTNNEIIQKNEEKDMQKWAYAVKDRETRRSADNDQSKIISKKCFTKIKSCHNQIRVLIQNGRKNGKCVWVQNNTELKKAELKVAGSSGWHLKITIFLRTTRHNTVTPKRCIN